MSGIWIDPVTALREAEILAVWRDWYACDHCSPISENCGSRVSFFPQRKRNGGGYAQSLTVL